VDPKQKKIKSKSILAILFLLLLVIISGCGGGGNSNNQPVIEPVIIPPTTKVVDNSTEQALVSISQDQNILTFSQMTQTLQSLKPNDVLVFGNTPQTPNGLLRKVISVNQQGSQVLVSTEIATLEEAIQQGTVKYEREITPNDIDSTNILMKGVTFKSVQSRGLETEFRYEIQDAIAYDKDGNLNTKYDQITFSGSIGFKPSIAFEYTNKGFTLTGLVFTIGMDETIELEWSALAPIADGSKEWTIATHKLKPYTVWINAVPVVVCPVITVSVGLEGKLAIGVKTKITQTASLKAGLTYLNGQWTPIANFSNNFETNLLTPSLEADVKGYLKLKHDEMIYGTAGPNLALEGYAELQVDPFDNPQWELFGGIAADAGVSMKILSKKIADYGTRVYNYKVTIAKAEYDDPSTILSGRITDSNGEGIPDVTLTFNNGTLGETTTTSDGRWSKSGLSGTVTVTPIKNGWTFNPVNKQITVPSANVDFMAIKDSIPTPIDTFFDNFEDGNLSGWSMFGGTWSVQNQQLYGNLGWGSMCLVDNTNFTDFIFEADLSIESHNAGLIFRVTEPTGIGFDGYKGYFVGISTSEVFLGKANNSWQKIAGFSMSITPNTIYHMKINVKGSNIKIYLNDMTNPKIDINDSTWTQGQIGVRVYGTSAYFDNINVNKQ
jgi:hypothetical protein